MNITFLVGNGFDISTGVDTSYHSFYKWYCEQDKENCSDNIKNFKAEISKDLAKPDEEKTWADFEAALGAYTEKFQADEVDLFLECYLDATDKLQSYIANQIAPISNTISVEAQESFAQSLYAIDQELSSQERQVISTFLPVKADFDILFSFISFNYTSILDDFVSSLSQPIYTWTKGQSHSVRTTSNVLHVHGLLDNGALIGVDNVNQIKNPAFRDDPRILEYLIKPNTSQALGETVQEAAFSTIKSSGIICLWGLSLGETDTQWWKSIITWLKGSSVHHLIIFWYDKKKVTKRVPLLYLNRQSEIKEKLLSYGSLNKAERNSLLKQIHIVFNTEKVLRATAEHKETIIINI